MYNKRLIGFRGSVEEEAEDENEAEAIRLQDYMQYEEVNTTEITSGT
jgi:hypothetical protein